MIVIADAGPILHLYWVNALTWALPQQPIEVVGEVWDEVNRHAPDALLDDRLRRCHTEGPPYPRELSSWSLDPGELAALSCAMRSRERDEVLVLCDEHEARDACAHLDIPVTGSIGLIVRACHAGHVNTETAEAALRELPRRGRLHATDELIEMAVGMLANA